MCYFALYFSTLGKNNESGVAIATKKNICVLILKIHYQIMGHSWV